MSDKLKEDTWLLLGDAQNWYGREYWGLGSFVKQLPEFAIGRLFIVIAATYDLSIPESPEHFECLEHFADTAISADEAMELFAMNLHRENVGFREYMEDIMSLSQLARDKIHVGVVIQGIVALLNLKKESGQPQDEESARKLLRSGDFEA